MTLHTAAADHPIRLENVQQCYESGVADVTLLDAHEEFSVQRPTNILKRLIKSIVG